MTTLRAWLLLAIATLSCWLGATALFAAGRSNSKAFSPEAFADPPASARPWVYWMWMDGNLSREGITADFEAMKRAGIGGVIVMEVNVGIPQGPVNFMSPEWRQLFQHVINEAERLGLQVTLNAGPGWTGSGGPWVKPEQSMQHIVASAVEVAGPEHFDQLLPQPQRRPAFFGDGVLPPELEKAKNDFYRDVAVLAFPTPAGNERIGDIDEKALYVRAPYSSQPNVRSFLPASASYPALPPGAVIESARIVDLSDRVGADGRLTWDAPAGHWTILRFGRTSTGANTRPAPKPGLGLECDKLDKAALDAHFDRFIGTLLRELGPRTHSADSGWTSLHIDSWEMSSQNWTPAFRDEFHRRRGYDLLRYLPAVTGRVVENLEVSERFLWDLRVTAQELMIENHAEHLKELGRRHGLSLSIEPYDMMPCADMSFGAVAEVPMCEFWLYGFDTSYSVFEAASIAHTCGRPIVAAESFTSSDAERWQAHPASMKALGDWAFCAGVNRVVFHRYQHQPWLDWRPGMTMGPYGVHWERTQTWWDMVPAYHRYLARCQFLLRQGLPVADICYLVAEGAPHVFRPPPSATVGHPPDRRGYNFDGCAPETFLSRMSVKDGRLVLPDGMSYRVLVLPECDTMTPRLLRKVKELVAAGATVIGPRPLKSPSLSGYPKCDAEVKQLADQLWGEERSRMKTERSDGIEGYWSDGKGDGRSAPQPHRSITPLLQHSNTPALHPSIIPGRVICSTGYGSAQPVSVPAHPLANARWIWFNEGQPANRAPVGKRCFRRLLILEPSQRVVAATLTMTADNAFECFVNGRKSTDGDNFTRVYTADLTPLLKPGTNIVAVIAENGGDAPNPAGMIGSVLVELRDGAEQNVATDGQWQAAETPGPDWMTNATAGDRWSTALELGPFDMAPWRLGDQTVQEPPQYGDFAVVASVLAQMGVPPDFECAAARVASSHGAEFSALNAQASGSLRYTHRRLDQTDLYFLANAEDRALTVTCMFRVAGKEPELWDPITGATRDLPEFRSSDGRTTVPMRFEPHQSFFVVFSKPARQTPPQSPNFPEAATVAELTGPWDVCFDPKWGGPKQISFPALEDWTGRPEEGIRFYSGIATYQKSFDLAASGSDPGHRLYLDLGEVKNLARVRLNGRDLGVVWCAPWRVDITSAARAGGNRLEIEVANLWPNRLVGDEQLPADCEYGRGGNLARWPDWLQKNEPRPSQGRYTFTTWKHFAKGSPLLPSGLLGPVRVLRSNEVR